MLKIPGRKVDKKNYYNHVNVTFEHIIPDEKIFNWPTSNRLIEADHVS